MRLNWRSNNVGFATAWVEPSSTQPTLVANDLVSPYIADVQRQIQDSQQSQQSILDDLAELQGELKTGLQGELKTGTVIDVEELSTLNRAIAEHELRRDDVAKEFFKELLAENMIFRRATGATVSKAGFLKDLSGASPFAQLKAEAIDVRTLDGVEDRALVTLMIVGTNDQRMESRYWNIRLFSKADNKYKWRLEFWYNYAIAGL
jgi:hypothetical protein